MNTALVFLTTAISTLATQTSTFIHTYQNTTTAEVYDMVSDVVLRERIAISAGTFFFTTLTLLMLQAGGAEKPQAKPQLKPQAHTMVRRSMRKREFYYLE